MNEEQAVTEIGPMEEQALKQIEEEYDLSMPVYIDFSPIMGNPMIIGHKKTN